MKEKLTFSLFVTVFIGGLTLAITTNSLYAFSFSIFVMGFSGAILAGALIKYFSQEEIDLRDIKRERLRIRRSKAKTTTTKLSNLRANKIAAKK